MANKLHKFTVAEATSKMAQRAIIRVTPTVTASDAYADGDVLFTATEIPNAVLESGGCSKLVAAYLVDEDSQGTLVQLVFTEKNTDFGTIHATANVSYDNAVAANICGVGVVSADTDTIDIDNFKIHQANAYGTHNNTELALPFLLQAEDGSTSVYVSGIIADGTPTFSNADSLQLNFHIDY